MNGKYQAAKKSRATPLLLVVNGERDRERQLRFHIKVHEKHNAQRQSSADKI